MSKAPYTIYFMNNRLISFQSRDKAIAWVYAHAKDHKQSVEDYEILDASDFR
jgi:hypothetical protein